ncbi:MAG: ABC transporter permease [Firmicutes bacterium]|nr:ABC transporter permease [Bacillota bacterium]MDD3298544.1 ABC transporter permease [Bacillota bacterium]MDD3851316.1 ABC transporter permease [Bacillota bacterium]MDD4708103.1 ABC transporter permease [Bacillota bacterium]
MWKFIIRRVAIGIFILFVVVSTTFFFSRIVPSEPAQKWVGAHATEEQIEAAKIELGLDKPLYSQYIKYLGDLLKGDFGMSIVSHRPVSLELKNAIPNTLELVILSVILAFAIGLPIGVYSAIHENTIFDHLGRFISVGVISMPTFWVALMLQIIFSTKLGLLPLTGQMDTILKLTNPLDKITGFAMLDSVITGNWRVFKDLILHAILPILTLMSYSLGLTSRMTRSILLEVLNEDYIRASRAYGIKERIVIWKYAIKNVLGTVTTVLALSAGYALVNTFVIEAVFSWPGIGSYISRSVINLDYPAIIGVTLFASVSYIILNLIADIIVALDPRIRFVKGGD